MIPHQAHPRLLLLLLSFSLALASVAQQDQVRIAPLGKTVELKLETSADSDYVLESQAQLLNGQEWATLMQFRGGTPAPRNWVDPLCGSVDMRFFRLKKLLEGPIPQVSNLRLIDTTGVAHELYYNTQVKAVALVFTGTNYPAILPLASELAAVGAAAGTTNLMTWIITPSDTTQRETLANFATNLPPGLPILQDLTHAVTRTLSSGQTPEVVLVNIADWSIAYRGPILQQVDTGVGVRQSRFLADAVSDVLAQRPVGVSRSATLGDSAGIRPVATAAYGTQIAPMLLNHCMPCHSPGNIAPWSMTNHAAIKQFAPLIKSDVLAGIMPPWHADPKYSVFANAKTLSPDEASALVDWIDRGAPRGDGGDPLVNNPAQPEVDWPLGTPDAIISIPTQSIPASGTVDYRYLQVANPFSTNVWLRAVAVKPGNRTVVHHALAFKGSLLEVIALQGGLGGFFAGYVPGMDQTAYPTGTGKLLKPSDLIIIQMHYTASGTATTDKTQIGLYRAPTTPAKELITSAAYDTSFSIPPETPNVYVSALKSFSKQSRLYEFSPHMHFRGNSARFTLQYPDGSSEVILNVPDYFFNWQALYRLSEPKVVPAGTVLRCEGTFDNSVQNRFNPDPTQTVTFGEQSWEEMFIGYVNYSELP